MQVFATFETLANHLDWMVDRIERVQESRRVIPKDPRMPLRLQHELEYKQAYCIALLDDLKGWPDDDGNDFITSKRGRDLRRALENPMGPKSIKTIRRVQLKLRTWHKEATDAMAGHGG